MKVLLVDDEEELVNTLKKILLSSSFEVDVCYNGKEAIDQCKQKTYDAIVLDIMMPVMDGISCLKELRGMNIKTPVILLSAKSQIEDKVLGLNSGADDYLTKPFSSKELVARIMAVSRRNNEIIDPLKFSNFELFPNNYFLKCGDKKYRLTRKEFQLLEYLIKNKDSFVSSEQLLSNVWDSDTDSFVSTVWVFISTLRKKLKDAGVKAEIVASRGLGYQIKETHV